MKRRMICKHKVKKNKLNKNFFNKIIKKYDFHILQREIESYGYKYSFKNFVITSFALLILIALIAKYIKLQIPYMIVLMMTVLLIAPFLIRSQFKQMYEFKRFEMVTTYLDNMLPIFKRNPMISLSWNEVVDLLDGEMKEVVMRARNLIVNNTDNHEVLKAAFQIIESSFPNSRIHSMHQMMYTIELRNTKTYISSVDNMWIDIQSWIKRVSVFQKDLKDRKTKLIILSLITMFCNCIFVSMYTSNDIFSSFTNNLVYQISSTLFMISLIVTISVFQIKLNGEWLLDDQNLSINKKAIKSFEYIQRNDGNRHNYLNKVMALVSILLFVYNFVVSSNFVVSILCLYLSYYFYGHDKNVYKKHCRCIKKYLQIEFPSWLRDITLNLQNLTVINAIELSKSTSSQIMGYHIDNFLNNIYENPTKIQPFNQFLMEYNIEGVKSSMKVLYSLQSLDKEEMQKQTHYLIVRNQEMLEKSESIKNEEAIGSLKLMGFIPVASFIMQMLVSMGLLFVVMLNLMNSSVLL